MKRVWDEPDLRALRARYLYALAVNCAMPPPMVDSSRLLDLGLLIDGLEADRRAADTARAGG